MANIQGGGRGEELSPGCHPFRIHPCLKDTVTEKDHSSPDAVVVVMVDGPAIVNMLKPGAFKRFQEYAQDVFLLYLTLEQV